MLNSGRFFAFYFTLATAKTKKQDKLSTMPLTIGTAETEVALLFVVTLFFDRRNSGILVSQCVDRQVGPVYDILPDHIIHTWCCLYGE